jgi:carboxymethylenebutenolidase
MSEDRLREAIALYDRFTHEGMGRRAFMAELTRIAGGAAAAGLMLSSIAADAQAGPQVAADDPRISAMEIALPTDSGRSYNCYSAAPASDAEIVPCIFVIHENRGLNDHIRDVTRRLALAGFQAIAPDFLSLAGGTPAGEEDRARQLIGALDLARTVADGVTMIRHMRTLGGGAPRKTGVVGFCWGGAMVNRLAVAAGDALDAGVSFYGPAPDPTEAARVRAAMLIILAGLDERVNATARPWAEALRAAGRAVELREFPNVDHAFHNDTSAARYNREAAGQAWAATLGFFREHLRRRPGSRS